MIENIGKKIQNWKKIGEKINKKILFSNKSKHGGKVNMRKYSPVVEEACFVIT